MDRSVDLGAGGMVRDIRLAPHQLVERTTAQGDLFVLAHFGIPAVDATTWHLEIAGLIARPRALTFDQIRALPKRSLESFHQCAGFPRRPDIPTRRVGNVVWSGADLRHILEATGIKPEARFLWAYGLDRGLYENFPPSHYVKDMPLERLALGGVLLAYEMNNEPLTPSHGYPVRLVIPGYYGTNSVKWLGRLELAYSRSTGPFTTVLYNDPAAPASNPTGQTTVPVWEAGPEAIIVTPKTRSILDRSSIDISGWAWGSVGIESVELSVDGGSTWFSTSLEERCHWSWQRFAAEWIPSAGGAFKIMARATDKFGITQPLKRARNAVHMVRVEIAS